MAAVPRHSQPSTKVKKPSITSSKGWPGLKLQDLIDFDQELAKKYNRTPHAFQQEAIQAQLLRKDTIVHAGTGAGKTTIAAGPHAHGKVKGMVTFMISPLIALQEEQVSFQWIRNEDGLTYWLVTGFNFPRKVWTDGDGCELNPWQLHRRGHECEFYQPFLRLELTTAIRRFARENGKSSCSHQRLSCPNTL